MRRSEHVAVGDVAHSLTVDERVWWVHEVVRDKPRFGPHRYQVFFVRRGDYQYRFEKELGSAFLWPKAHHFNFFAGGEYSVGECMEIAERLREGQPAEAPQDEEAQRLPILERYKRELDEKRAQREHRTVVGASIRIQRE